MDKMSKLSIVLKLDKWLLSLLISGKGISSVIVMQSENSTNLKSPVSPLANYGSVGQFHLRN